MASLIPNVLPKDPHTQIYLVGITLTLLIVVVFAITFTSSKEGEENLSGFQSYLKFFYASFVKPHTGDGTGNGQQDALESFYKAQAGVYDATRKRLLRGREDMLGLVAAQLIQKSTTEDARDEKCIWVDVSIAIRSSCQANDVLRRLVAELAGTSNRCRNSSRSQSSSRASTLSTSLPPSAKLLESDSQDWDGQM
jgi:hypothetical protein